MLHKTGGKWLAGSSWLWGAVLAAVSFSSCESNGVGPAPVNPAPELSSRPAVFAFPGERISPVTEEEWTAVSGTARVECTESGTEVSVQMDGLIPNGVYSLWLHRFRYPGFDPAAPTRNRKGSGCLGASDGSENWWVASVDGTGGLSVTVERGELSMGGYASGCLLSSTYELQVIGAYHADGRTWGPVPGPEDVTFAQFVFVFENDDLTAEDDR